MATWSVWWRGFRTKPQVRPVTFLSGPEKILADEVLGSVRRLLVVPDWNYVPLSVGEDSERAVWAEVFALPAGLEATRLVVVRRAERLKHPERLVEFAKRADAHPNTHVVLLWDGPVPRQEPNEDQRRRGAKGDIVPWLALGTKIHQIECRPFTSDTAAVAVAWVRSKTGMRESVAAHLLNRADGNLRLVRDTCAKLSVFPGEATISAVNDLLSARPRDTFVDALVAMDKKGALAALERLQPEEFSRTLGLLDAHLDLAGMVHDMTLAHASAGDIAKRAGNRNFLVRELIPVARHYSSARRASIRRVMALADDALRSGARIGVLESVVALW